MLLSLWISRQSHLNKVSPIRSQGNIIIFWAWNATFPLPTQEYTLKCNMIDTWHKNLIHWNSWAFLFTFLIILFQFFLRSSLPHYLFAWWEITKQTRLFFLLLLNHHLSPLISLSHSKPSSFICKEQTTLEHHETVTKPLHFILVWFISMNFNQYPSF